MPKATTYIINGTCAEEGAQPWLAQIQNKHSANYYKHLCGGVIITEDYIVSAAHCFRDLYEFLFDNYKYLKILKIRDIVKIVSHISDI